MNIPLDWLLEGPEWVRCRAMLDLQGLPMSVPEVQHTREKMLADAAILGLINELSGWSEQVVNNHKSAGLLYHKVNFLVDLGLTAADAGLEQAADQILEHASPEGPFQVVMNISKSFGGSGENTWAWALCDAPNLVYALIKLGLGEEPRVKAAAAHLRSLVRENGWPCAVSAELGKFRGPGRKSDPCPYANLAVLKVLSLHEGTCSNAEAYTGVETILNAWEKRQVEHAYMFYMGTDFGKLKAPLVWYDLLHVLDTLSMFPHCHSDTRMQEMVDVLAGKMDAEGKFTGESVWTAWKDWEFGQKKEPSRWITLLAWRVLRRMGR